MLYSKQHSSSHLTFSFSSSLAQSTLLSSCASCWLNASTVSQPRDLAKSLVETLLLSNCSCREHNSQRQSQRRQCECWSEGDSQSHQLQKHRTTDRLQFAMPYMLSTMLA